MIAKKWTILDSEIVENNETYKLFKYIFLIEGSPVKYENIKLRDQGDELTIFIIYFIFTLSNI